LKEPVTFYRIFTYFSDLSVI